MSFLRNIFKKVSKTQFDVKQSKTSAPSRDLLCFTFDRQDSKLGYTSPADVLSHASGFILNDIGRENILDALWDLYGCYDYDPNTRFSFLVNGDVTERLKKSFTQYLVNQGCLSENIQCEVYKGVSLIAGEIETFDALPKPQKIQHPPKREAIIRQLRPR